MNSALRADFEHIAAWVSSRAAVLDLGCSDGKLLLHLSEVRQAEGYGVDISTDHVVECIANGVPVEQLDIDDGLGMFSEDQFDYVILSQTLQGVREPARVLGEMMRVGKKAIVSFPNFGFWRLRRQMLMGRMPVSKYLPYQWYNTTNMRYCTIDDFDRLCEEHGFRILERMCLANGGKVVGFMPNLMAELALYQLEKKEARKG